MDKKVGITIILKNCGSFFYSKIKKSIVKKIRLWYYQIERMRTKEERNVKKYDIYNNI